MASFDALKASRRLPAPSEAVLDIIRLAQDPSHASAQELARLVLRRPALTAPLLKLANAPHGKNLGPAATVGEAIARLGGATLRLLATGLSMLAEHRRGACRTFDYEGFWSAALLRAVALHELACREPTVTPGEAFGGGLVAEIGQLALASAFPVECGEPPSSDGEAAGPDERQRARCPVDHRQVTLRMLEDWEFPELFLEAVAAQPCRAHAGRARRRIDRLGAQLRLASGIAEFGVAGPGAWEAMLPGLRASAAALGLDAAALRELSRTVAVRWQEWGRLLGVATRELPSLGPERRDDPPATGPAPPPPGLRVLVLDDDPLQLVRLGKKLRAEGHAVATARNGEEGLAQVAAVKPQLILTDWRMAPMDGLEFCKALRSTAEGRQIYVIMLTADESEESLYRAFEAGADDFIAKPVNDRVLIARMRGGQRIVQLQEELAQGQRAIRRYAAELAIANRQLEAMAMTDALTQLPNRRFAEARLDREWPAEHGARQPLALLILDLDYFKRINDTLGHPAGDRVLAHAAKVFRGAVRADDLVCRLGGEEFLVIAAHADIKAAEALGERIRQAVEGDQPPDLPLASPVTVSVGGAVALANDAAGGWRSLLARADQALYEAKAAGRNAVRVAPAA